MIFVTTIGEILTKIQHTACLAKNSIDSKGLAGAVFIPFSAFHPYVLISQVKSPYTRATLVHSSRD